MATLAPRAPQYLLAFLPWLRLGQEQNLAGVRFVPFRDRDERVHPLLAEFEPQVHRILSSYIDIEGQPLDNCTIATIDERGWNLADDDFDAVNWAASLLFLCAWARNE